MGDTVGWAGNELLLWHLLCIGNGAAQQKGTRALPDHLCVPSKPESEAVKSGIARNSRMLKRSFLTLSIRWLVTNSGRRLMTPPWTDGTDSHLGNSAQMLTLLVTEGYAVCGLKIQSNLK